MGSEWLIRCAVIRRGRRWWAWSVTDTGVVVASGARRQRRDAERVAAQSARVYRQTWAGVAAGREML
jgi:hypothetical protein